MKLQPFFLFLSLLLFILSSCEQAEKSRSYQLVRSDQTLAFTLDDKTKNVTPFLSYYRDKKGKEYIVLQSYSMQSRSNKFYFYDKDSQELAFKIEPEIEGSNGVGRVLDAIYRIGTAYISPAYLNQRSYASIRIAKY